MDAIFTAALSGLQSATASFATSASRVAAAQTPGSTGDLAAEFVNMTMAKEDYRANAAVLKADDEMMGTLFDILI